MEASRGADDVRMSSFQWAGFSPVIPGRIRHCSVVPVSLETAGKQRSGTNPAAAPRTISTNTANVKGG